MRIQQLLEDKQTFSIETTLASRSYHKLIKQAHGLGYKVELLFFYLPSVRDALDRVRLRVKSGGHNIPEDVIYRRYEAGLENLFNIYMPIVDVWHIIDNRNSPSRIIAEKNRCLTIYQKDVFNKLNERYGK